VHVDLLYGENSHHIAEASFKSLARALRTAAAVDTRLQGQVASTKGSL
jgi:imidazoleglycerol-phosphate dehydratase